MASFLWNIVSTFIPSSWERRLFKYALRRTLSPYLKTELRLEQLNGSATSGELELHNLELDPVALNKHLGDLPFKISSGFIGSITIRVDWNNLQVSPCHVDVDRVEITLVTNDSIPPHSVLHPSHYLPHPAAQTAPSPDEMAADFFSRERSSGLESVFSHDPVADADYEPHPDGVSPTVINDANMSPDMDGVAALEDIIYALIHKVSLSITSIAVRFQHYSPIASSHAELLLSLPFLSFADKTEHDPAKRPNVWHKELSFAEWKLQLVEQETDLPPSFPGSFDPAQSLLFTEPGTDPSFPTILCGGESTDPNLRNTLSIHIRSKYAEPSKDPDYFVDLNIISASAAVSAPQLELLSELVSAFLTFPSTPDPDDSDHDDADDTTTPTPAAAPDAPPEIRVRARIGALDLFLLYSTTLLFSRTPSPSSPPPPQSPSSPLMSSSLSSSIEASTARSSLMSSVWHSAVMESAQTTDLYAALQQVDHLAIKLTPSVASSKGRLVVASQEAAIYASLVGLDVVVDEVILQESSRVATLPAPISGSSFEAQYNESGLTLSLLEQLYLVVDVKILERLAPFLSPSPMVAARRIEALLAQMDAISTMPTPSFTLSQLLQAKAPLVASLTSSSAAQTTTSTSGTATTASPPPPPLCVQITAPSIVLALVFPRLDASKSSHYDEALVLLAQAATATLLVPGVDAQDPVVDLSLHLDSVSAGFLPRTTVLDTSTHTPAAAATLSLTQAATILKSRQAEISIQLRTLPPTTTPSSPLSPPLSSSSSSSSPVSPSPSPRRGFFTTLVSTFEGQSRQYDAPSRKAAASMEAELAATAALAISISAPSAEIELTKRSYDCLYMRLMEMLAVMDRAAVREQSVQKYKAQQEAKLKLALDQAEDARLNAPCDKDDVFVDVYSSDGSDSFFDVRESLVGDPTQGVTGKGSADSVDSDSDSSTGSESSDSGDWDDDFLLTSMLPQPEMGMTEDELAQSLLRARPKSTAKPAPAAADSSNVGSEGGKVDGEDDTGVPQSEPAIEMLGESCVERPTPTTLSLAVDHVAIEMRNDDSVLSVDGDRFSVFVASQVRGEPLSFTAIEVEHVKLDHNGVRVIGDGPVTSTMSYPSGGGGRDVPCLRLSVLGNVDPRAVLPDTVVSLEAWQTRLRLRLERDDIGALLAFVGPAKEWDDLESVELPSAPGILHLNVLAHDSVVSYLPVHHPAELDLGVRELRVSSNIVHGVSTLGIEVSVRDAEVFLHADRDSFLSPALSETRASRGAPSFTRHYVDDLGFARLAELDYAQVFVKMRDVKDADANLEIDVENENLHVHLAKDSLRILGDLLGYVGSGLDSLDADGLHSRVADLEEGNRGDGDDGGEDGDILDALEAEMEAGGGSVGDESDEDSLDFARGDTLLDVSPSGPTSLALPMSKGGGDLSMDSGSAMDSGSPMGSSLMGSSSVYYDPYPVEENYFEVKEGSLGAREPGTPPHLREKEKRIVEVDIPSTIRPGILHAEAAASGDGADGEEEEDWFVFDIEINEEEPVFYAEAQAKARSLHTPVSERPSVVRLTSEVVVSGGSSGDGRGASVRSIYEGEDMRSSLEQAMGARWVGAEVPESWPVVVENYFTRPGRVGDRAQRSRSVVQGADVLVRLKGVNAQVSLHDGLDFPGMDGGEGGGGRSEDCIQAVFRGAHVECVLFEEEVEEVMDVRVDLEVFEVVDAMATSTLLKMVSGLEEDEVTRAQQGSKLPMVKIRFSLTGSDGEARVQIRAVPLRINVDQYALEFAHEVYSWDGPVLRGVLDVLEREMALESNAERQRQGKDDQVAEELFFQLVDIRGVHVRVDYTPRRLPSLQVLEGEHLWELLNLVPISDLPISVPSVKILGKSASEVASALADAWTPKTTVELLEKLVAAAGGVSPLRPVVSLGTGLSDLVLLPLEYYGRDGRVGTGIQRGVSSFLRRLAVEASNMGANLAVGAHVVLEQADDLLTPSHVPRSESRAISKYAGQPSNVSEGVRHAYRSLARGIQDAGTTVFAVPVQEYEQTGVGGMVKSVIRAVPVAMVQTSIGLSEAVAKGFMGVSNSLDPSRYAHVRSKYKV